MSVDYFHRLIISGPTRDLRTLRAGLATDYVRVVGGEEYAERLPFSFAGLFSLARAAKRYVPGDALEPFDVRVWPIQRRSRASRVCGGIGASRWYLPVSNPLANGK